MKRRAQVDGWMVGGSCDPRGRQVFGFSEQEAAMAAIGAYYDALGRSAGSDRDAALVQLQAEFGAALAELVQ